VLTLDAQKCDGMHARETYAITVQGMWYCQKQKWAYNLIMFWGMMFAGVIGAIEDTLLPKILELALCMLTFELTKLLIHQFGGLGNHCSHCEALGSDVVNGDGSGSQLGVAMFLLCGLKWGSKLAAKVEHGEFCLRG
jgi:hypothetical protein